jgi:hypothetical protein
MHVLRHAIKFRGSFYTYSHTLRLRNHDMNRTYVASVIIYKLTLHHKYKSPESVLDHRYGTRSLLALSSIALLNSISLLFRARNRSSLALSS